MTDMKNLNDAKDTINELLAAHGLRRTSAGRAVMAWMLQHAETSWTHAKLSDALFRETALSLDRVTLYRLLDRLAQVGLLIRSVDSERVRHYQAVPATAVSAETMPHFECQACHRNFELEAASAQFEKAARAALEALEAVGHLGLSVDFSVHGVCVDCTPATGHAA